MPIPRRQPRWRTSGVNSDAAAISPIATSSRSWRAFTARTFSWSESKARRVARAPRPPAAVPADPPEEHRQVPDVWATRTPMPKIPVVALRASSFTKETTSIVVCLQVGGDLEEDLVDQPARAADKEVKRGTDVVGGLPQPRRPAPPRRRRPGRGPRRMAGRRRTPLSLRTLHGTTHRQDQGGGQAELMTA